MKRIAIVGGGPAGAMAAERLLTGGSRDGARVTIFEEKPGWEKPCGGGLPYKALRRYPFLLEATEEHTCVRDAELVAANGASARFRLRQPLVIYSRAVLNRLLLRRAEQAGSEVVEDRIVGFERQGRGWRLHGRHTDYAADYLILATGARSALRGRLVEPFAARDFMLTFGYYSPLGEPSSSLRREGLDRLLRVQFFEEFEGYAWAFPRPDHLSLGICGKAVENTMSGLKERLHAFMEQLGYGGASGDAETPDNSPVFSHLLPALGTESWSNLRIAGDGWALAGDAAGLVDPVTGEGIYFAMRSGELLAESLNAGLDGDALRETYTESIRRDFGRKLALGSRLARLFYHGDFLGKASTTRLVEFSARSDAFMSLVQDLLEGSQSYSGLAARLYRGLGRTAVEMVTGGRRQNGIRYTANSRRHEGAG